MGFCLTFGPAAAGSAGPVPPPLYYALKIAYYAFWHCSNFVPITLDYMLLHSLVIIHSLMQKPA